MNIRYPIYEGVYRILTDEGARRKLPVRVGLFGCAAGTGTRTAAER